MLFKKIIQHYSVLVFLFFIGAFYASGQVADKEISLVEKDKDISSLLPVEFVRAYLLEQEGNARSPDNALEEKISNKEKLQISLPKSLDLPFGIKFLLGGVDRIVKQRELELIVDRYVLSKQVSFFLNSDIKNKEGVSSGLLTRSENQENVSNAKEELNKSCDLKSAEKDFITQCVKAFTQDPKGQGVLPLLHQVQRFIKPVIDYVHKRNKVESNHLIQFMGRSKKESETYFENAIKTKKDLQDFILEVTLVLEGILPSMPKTCDLLKKLSVSSGLYTLVIDDKK